MGLSAIDGSWSKTFRETRPARLAAHLRDYLPRGCYILIVRGVVLLAVVISGCGANSVEDGRTDAGNAPDGAAAPGPTRGTHIALGGEHSCVLQDADHVVCWGSNELGQLGVGAQVSQSTKPMQVAGLAGVVQLAGGEFHTCALLADRRVACWGRNNCGQTGQTGFEDVPTPTIVPGIDGAAEVALGYSASCVRRIDGTVTCWGCGLGDGFIPRVAKGINGATSIAVGGGDFACAAREDDTLWCWGDNEFGNLGNGTATDALEPIVVPSVTKVAAVGLGAWDSCVAHHDGTVECWGANSVGQLGDGKPTPARSIPAPVPGLKGAVGLALGWLHSCALLSDGTERCWGANYAGQLGDGNDENLAQPTEVKGLTGAVEIAVGLDHSCAWRGQGDVMCWGSNYKGQLGDGTTTFRSTAVPVVW